MSADPRLAAYGVDSSGDTPNAGVPERAEDRTIHQRLDIDIAHVAVSEHDTHDEGLERYRRRHELSGAHRPTKLELDGPSRSVPDQALP